MLHWLFLDMNSFFASAEQHDDPALRGRPVGVVPVDSEFTGLIAASVECKAAGVPMGTSVRDARSRCPEIRILKARPNRYVEIHHALKAATDKHVPIQKVYSIDEWAARLLGEQREPAGATALAQRIRRQIATDLSPALRCSIGLAPTRLLAKTACELHKPDGLTVLTTDMMPEALDGLPLQFVPGIGGGMARRLEQHGILDLRALWNLSYAQARQIWGSVQGEHFWLGFHGIDAPEVRTRRQSMGHAHVLPPALRNERDAFAILIRLLCKLGSRLREQGYWASGMRVGVRYMSDQGWGEGRGFPAAADTPTLLAYLKQLWDRRPPKAVIRADPKQVSLDVVGLTDGANTPAMLFPEADRGLRLSQALDRINRRHGSHTLYFAAMHPVQTYEMDDKIAFGRIPDTAILM